MTTEAAEDPCPCEAVVPDNAPGLIDNAEHVLHVVVSDQWISWDGGIPRLSVAALRNEDIDGKDNKSVSCVRDKYMPPEALLERSKKLNRCPEWQTDPVVARASVLKLREIRNESWREVCVWADPTGEDDKAGACAEHASVTRSRARPGKSGQLERNKRRSAIAETFSELSHVISKQAPKLAT